MVGLLKISFKHSTSHEVFPQIILGILAIFLGLLLIQAIVKAAQTRKPLFQVKGKRFFIDNYDKLKLFGSLVLLVLYALTMPTIGFIFSGILFISLFHLLYAGRKDLKSIAFSIGLSVVETYAVWFVFGQLLNVTLP